MNFKEKVKEDVAQYNELLNAYSRITTEDYLTAFEISQKALVLSDRWNEIQVQAGKNDIGELSKTDFQKWAYGKYRTMQLLHEHTRSIWRVGEDFAKEMELINRRSK
jgi:hypothetical protein